jgi:hypothetical protein
MFGFFAPAKNSRKYRQVYAAYCSHQRQIYGTASSLFTSYKAVFLYLLALDCGACSAPSPATPTCCRMRNDWANNWNINREMADFCSAFAMLLAKTKLEDDRRDTKSLLPAIAGRVFRSAFGTSRRYFDVHFPGLKVEIEQSIRDHIDLEVNNVTGASSEELQRYAQPTANAFGAIFAAFETLCKIQQPSIDPLKFRKIGELVGATIIIADCMFDFERDVKRGEFTPLQSRSDVATAQIFAMSLASQLGWEVCEVAVGTAPRCVSVVMRAFERIGAFEIESTSNRKPRASNSFAIVPKRLSLLTNRAGDCDCGGGECFGACCDGACVGGDCGGGDCGGGNCCDCDGDGLPDCLRCCDPGSACDSCCDCGSDKGKEENNLTDQTDSGDPLVGQIAEAISPLRPTGFVRVGDRKIPAQIETGSVDAGAKVIILRKGNFGYIVDVE